MEVPMHIVLVHIHIKPETIDRFIEITKENVKNSIQEAGVVRFDFLQQPDDPARFMLVEVYHTPDDQVRHRETHHYQVWRDASAGMMAEARVGVKYVNLLPPDEAWKK
jgi:autoinducer 2-degrading protein